MTKKAINLLKGLVLLAFLGIANASFAQSVIANGGVTTDDYSCTLGETFVADNAGMWGQLYDASTSGVGSIVVDDIKLDINGDGTVTIALPDELVAKNATYCVYTLQGMLLDKQPIVSSPVTVKCDEFSASVLVLTVNVNGQQVAALKLKN